MPYAAQHRKYDDTGLIITSADEAAPTNATDFNGASMYDAHTWIIAPTATAGFAQLMSLAINSGNMLTQ